jgi:photosystem II stability/assembly factor-like uncharacterized protein
MNSGSVWSANWKPINTGLPSASLGASGLAIAPGNPSTLYSWNWGGGLFKSTDGAGSWEVVNGVAGLHWLVVDPRNSAALYAITSGFSIGTRGIHLLRSMDGGVRWTGLNFPDASFGVNSLVIDPQDSNTLYAVLFGTLTISKSTDGGATWKRLPDPADTNPGGPQGMFLTIDPVTPSTLYGVALNGEILKSTDAGESWITIKAGPCCGFSLLDFLDSVPLSVDPVTPSTIYAGSFAAATGLGPSNGHGSISKSSDGGQTWRAIRVGIPTEARVRLLVVDPASPSNVYASYSNDGGWGIIKSTDAGETWRVLNSDFPSVNFWGSPIVVDPQVPSTLYTGYWDPGSAATQGKSRETFRLGAGAGGILKSTNAGASWSPANAGRSLIDVRALAIDPVNSGTVYTATGTDGVFKSVDSGASWTKLAAFQFSPGIFALSGLAYVRSLLIDFTNPNILYAYTARAGGCSPSDNLLFKSTDGGATWSDGASPPMSGCFTVAETEGESGLLTVQTASQMVMDPTDPNTLYLGAEYIEGGLGLFKSTDGGANWNNPVFDCCDALVIDPSTPATVYGGSSGWWATPSGVFKSTDGGATWSRAGLNSGVNVLALDATDPGTLYAATQVSVSGSTGFGGLFKSTDGGANWFAINDGLTSLLDTRSPFTALLIDPGNSNVLYAGTSGYGVFRSTDGGAHWSPFNNGLTNLDVRVLALASGDPNALCAGTGSGIFVVNLTSDSIRLPAPAAEGIRVTLRRNHGHGMRAAGHYRAVLTVK